MGACNAGGDLAPPYPQSEVITDLTWKSLVTQQATGSDNWPVTWAEDSHLYTAYGDGWGFEPNVDSKLSMGFARVKGTPQTTIKGFNIRSPNEQEGDGRSGKKACGILSVNGTLYLWARNADNNGQQVQIAKSTDNAKTWTWGFNFKPFSHTDFIDFGKDYAGARDSYVFAVSVDGSDAYRPADRYCLMRVPKDKVMSKSAYEFFVETDDEGNPVWSSDISERGAIFSFPGECYRHGISYGRCDIMRYRIKEDRIMKGRMAHPQRRNTIWMRVCSIRSV